MEHVLTSYEVDFENAELHNKKTLVSFPDDGSVPDGMCISDEGLLLVAMWGGSRIEIYDQKGKKQSVIDMPVKQPSSCTFGGANGDRLIVTSARASLGDSANELDGGLFIVDGLGLTGAQSEKFNG
jgi:sugar lactone lactonase YvrE